MRDIVLFVYYSYSCTRPLLRVAVLTAAVSIFRYFLHYIFCHSSKFLSVVGNIYRRISIVLYIQVEIVSRVCVCQALMANCRCFRSIVGYDLNNRYGAGTGQIWMDNVACTGTETHLFNCRHNGWGRHNCGHYEDVSIRCFRSSYGNISTSLYRVH